MAKHRPHMKFSKFCLVSLVHLPHGPSEQHNGQGQTVGRMARGRTVGQMTRTHKLWCKTVTRQRLVLYSISAAFFTACDLAIVASKGTQYLCLRLLS